jgi:hypothetical protein
MESHTHDENDFELIVLYMHEMVLTATAHSFHDLHDQVTVLQFDCNLIQTEQFSYFSFIQF